ncbi:MAG: sodium:calcium antiporter [Actinomycetota bacterium]
MPEPLQLSLGLPAAVGALVVAAAAIAAAGSRLSRVIDRLADRTGLGEAIAGMVLLGAATSLSGLATSVLAAGFGNASLAVSNSMGGIAIQTLFLVVADVMYRRVNLEHAAASLTNIFTSLLMILLLAIVVLGAAAPPVTVLGVHPATVLLVGAYVYGIVLSRRASTSPMWQPERTRATREDVPASPPADEGLAGLWVRLGVLALVVLLSGYVVATSGVTIAEQTGVSGTTVGTFLTGVATSLPELVTTLAAVRAGALTLAVAGIVGGNTFDVLFVAAADVAYREGSVYAALAQTDLFVIGWTMLMVVTLAAGLVQRDRTGIGFEGVAVIAIYVGGLATVPAIG